MASPLPTSSAQRITSGEHDIQDGQGEVPPGSVELSSENFVEFSSQLIAAYRAIESRREDRLFNDMFAERLAGRDAMEICGGVQRPPEEADASSANAAAANPSAAGAERRREEVMRWMRVGGKSRKFSVRTRFLDDFFEDCTMSRGIKQVVLLGAGMDTRGRRLKATEGTKVFEVDQAVVLRVKHDLLSAPGLDVGKEEGGVACARVLGVESDLSVVGWQDDLLEAGFDSSSPSAWILEGLTMYLEEDVLKDILRVVNNLCSPGSALCVAFTIKESIFGGGGFSEDLTSVWKFTTNDPAAFMEAQFPGSWSFQSVTYGIPGEYPDGADYGVGCVDKARAFVVSFS